MLEYGFAYGPTGKKLKSKYLLACVTTGGSREDYAATDGDEHEIGTFLSPLRQTARLCGMEFLPPSVLHKADHISADGAQAPILAHPKLLAALRDDRL